jgi:hypothetical protein
MKKFQMKSLKPLFKMFIGAGMLSFIFFAVLQMIIGESPPDTFQLLLRIKAMIVFIGVMIVGISGLTLLKD